MWLSFAFPCEIQTVDLPALNVYQAPSTCLILYHRPRGPAEVLEISHSMGILQSEMKKPSKPAKSW